MYKSHAFSGIPMLLKQYDICSADAVICVYAVSIKMLSACTAYA